MGIAILLEDEHGDVLETIEWPTWLDRLLPSYDDESFQCLRFVDPYGDTIFNVVQMPTLLREVERLNQIADSDPQHAHLGEIRRLAERCRDGVHTYIRFYGD